MKLKDLNVKLKLDSKQFHTGLTKAGGAVKAFGSGVTGASGIASKALRGIGNVARGIGNIFRKVLSNITRMLKLAFKIGMVAAVAAIGLGIKAAVDFEEQLANVNTMLDASSEKYLPEYADAMKRLAMEFGEGTKTLSKGLYDILSASISPTKAIDVLRVSIMAAKGGMTDAGIAADAITTILNSYGLSASNAADVSDWLFAIVKRGKLTFGDLASGIGKVASTAAIAGVSLEDLGAMVATMTRAGIRSEEAMTAMNGVLRSFLGATDTAKKKAKELGFEMSTNTLRTKGLLWIMKKMNDLTAEQVRELFPNIRGLKGIAAALQQVENYEYDVEYMTNRAGLAMQAFQKMTGTTKFALGKLWQSILSVVRGLGEELIPYIKKAGDSISKWFKKIREGGILKNWIESSMELFKNLKDIISSVFSSLFNLLLDVKENKALDTLQEKFTKMFSKENIGKLTDAVTVFITKFLNGLHLVYDFIQVMLLGVKAILYALSTGITGLLKGIEKGAKKFGFKFDFKETYEVLGKIKPPTKPKLGMPGEMWGDVYKREYEKRKIERKRKEKEYGFADIFAGLREVSGFKPPTPQIPAADVVTKAIQKQLKGIEQRFKPGRAYSIIAKGIEPITIKGAQTFDELLAEVSEQNRVLNNINDVQLKIQREHTKLLETNRKIGMDAAEEYRRQLGIDKNRLNQETITSRTTTGVME